MWAERDKRLRKGVGSWMSDPAMRTLSVHRLGLYRGFRPHPFGSKAFDFALSTGHIMPRQGIERYLIMP